MPKIKTNKTAAKRFKITGTGKITRRRSHNSHQFLHKNQSRRRRLEQEPEIFQGEQKRVRRLLVLRLTKGVKVHPYDKSAGKPNDRATLVAILAS